MELFQQRGYDRTTVEEIAARAGLTERTFFRYFTDKREVLFSGSKELEQLIVTAIAEADRELAPLEIVVRAFEAAGAALQAMREFSHVRARYELVIAHAELRERELIKMASLAAAVTKTLLARGVGEPAASMAAEVGIAAFKVGFERWANGKKPHDFPAQIRAALEALQSSMTAQASSGGQEGEPKPIKKRATRRQPAR